MFTMEITERKKGRTMPDNIILWNDKYQLKFLELKKNSEFFSPHNSTMRCWRDGRWGKEKRKQHHVIGFIWLQCHREQGTLWGSNGLSNKI